MDVAVGTGPGTRTAPVLALSDIAKAYPGAVALDGVSLSLRAGEIHALLGENGAGKSTLVGILAGTHRADAGTLLAGGQVLAGHSPSQARKLGIYGVPQRPVLVPTLTVTENLLLGGAWWRRPARAAAAARFRASCMAFGADIEPDQPAGRLTPAQQTLAEIVRALDLGARALVLDEPTSPLGPAAADALLAALRRLRAQGLAILLITHRLDEALAVADRVTVLRRGRVAGALDAAALAGVRGDVAAQVRAMMFGTDPADHAAATATVPRGAGACGAGACGAGACGAGAGTLPVLQVEGLSTPALSGIALSVAAGETLGVAGIEGSGQASLADAIAGLVRPLSGSIALNGVPLAGLSAATRRRMGVRHLSGDRVGEGSVGAVPLALNLLLKRIGTAPFWRAGLRRDRAIAAHAQAAITAFDIRAPHPWTPAAALSGGNLQKLLLARELDAGARLIVWHNPTVGLDLRSAAAVQARLRRAAAEGAANLLMSADLDEVLALSDRIAVLARGRLAGVVPAGPHARAQVGALMLS